MQTFFGRASTTPRPPRTRLRRGAAACALVAVGALLLSACSSHSGSGAGAKSSNVVASSDATKTGGNVTMLMTSVAARFDPVVAPAFSFTSNSPMNAIFGLLAYHDVASNSIKMGFLQSITPSTDFKTWTMKLKPNLKFSDDTPFDAAAIAYNLARFADPTTGSLFLKDGQAIASTEVVDATTLKVNLKDANAFWDSVVVEDFSYVGSPTAEKAMGANYGTAPVAAGPFKFKSIDPGQQLVVVRNPNYAAYAPGEPKLDQVTFQTVADFPKEAQALGSNDAQMAAPYGQGTNDLFRAQPNLNVFSTQTGAGGNVQFSFKSGPFTDVRAREAVMLAVDRNVLAPAFHPATPEATNLFPANSPYYNTKYDFAPQDKVKAQQLFDQLAASGHPLDFTFTTTDAAQQLTFAQLLQSQLAAYKNVKMTIKSEPTVQYVTDQKAGNYQAIVNGLYLVNPIPELSNFVETGGTLNTMGYSNPKVDAAVADLKTQSDKQKQIDDYGVIQQSLNDDWAVMWVQKGLLGFAASKDLSGITLVNYGNSALWGTIGYKA